MNEDQILDQPGEGGSEGKEFVQRNLAGSGKRFANLIIDTIVYYAIAFVASVLYASALSTTGEEVTTSALYLVLIYGLIILYPWAMESLTGKTIGKFITRTKVVKEDGSRPTSVNILGRSLCRLIPFDAFSYLGGNPGWHDTIPKIYVINDE